MICLKMIGAYNIFTPAAFTNNLEKLQISEKDFFANIRRVPADNLLCTILFQSKK